MSPLALALSVLAAVWLLVIVVVWRYGQLRRRARQRPRPTRVPPRWSDEWRWPR